jgi:hypothetical protein
MQFSTDSSGFRPEDFLPLRDFLKRLPGVRAASAYTRLSGAYRDAVETQAATVTFWEATAPLDMAAQIFVRAADTKDRVSPKGAMLLLQLYRLGELPLEMSSPESVPTELSEYAAGRGCLLEEARRSRQALVAAPAA